MNKINIEEAQELYIKGHTFRDLAKKYNVTRAAISYSFKKHGIEVVRKSPQTATIITKKEIERLMSLGISIRKIAIREGVSTTIIRRILKSDKKRSTKSDITYSQSAKDKLSRERLIELVNSRLNNIQIAEKTGFNRHTIGYLLEYYRIDKNNYPLITKEKLIEYVNNGLTNKEIAVMTGLKIDTIRRYKIKYDLKNKKLWENVEITDILKEVIIGIYLGDGHISKPLKSINSHIEYGHSEDQGDLVKLVYVLLDKLMNERKIRVKPPTNNPNINTYFNIRTINHPYLTDIRNKYYLEKYFANGEALKRVDLELLQNMSDLSLALWFMDDGYIHNYNNIFKIVLCTQRFLMKDVKLLVNFLNNKWGLNSFINSKDSNLETGHDIVIKDNKSIEKFEKIILPFFIKCMRYKFPYRFIVPPWEDNKDYKSKYDILLDNAPNFPPPKIPNFNKLYTSIRNIKIINKESNIPKEVTYKIEHAAAPEVSNFLHNHHYLGRIKCASYYFKLIENEKLVGVAAFSKLRSKLQTLNMFKVPVTRNQGLDISRFICLDSCGKNTESLFMSECIKAIKLILPEIKFIVTYSQPEIGHHGYIYQATNWYYISNNAGGKIKYKLDGKITTSETIKKIYNKAMKISKSGRKDWREYFGNRLEITVPPPKYKFLYVLDKDLKKQLNIPYNPYPKF